MTAAKKQAKESEGFPYVRKDYFYSFYSSPVRAGVLTFPRPFLDLSSTFLAPLLRLPSLAWQGFPRPHEEALR